MNQPTLWDLLFITSMAPKHHRLLHQTFWRARPSVAYQMNRSSGKMMRYPLGLGAQVGPAVIGKCIHDRVAIPPISQSWPCSSRSLRPHACVIGWKCFELHVWSLKSPAEMSCLSGKPTHELWWAEFVTEMNHQHELSHCLEDASCHPLLSRTAEVCVFQADWYDMSHGQRKELMQGYHLAGQRCTYWWLKSYTTWTWNDVEKKEKNTLLSTD